MTILRRVHRVSLRGSLRAFSLLEMLVATSALAILSAIAIPSYRSHVQKVKVTAAVSDIMIIASAINRYTDNNNAPPPDLATVGMDTKLDPWDQPYVYLSFAGLKGKANMRKDKNLVPINTQYDLYSIGPDGKTTPPLTAAPSRDDVVLANDGDYIGLASDY